MRRSWFFVLTKIYLGRFKWKLLTDVSGQPLCPIFRVQKFKNLYLLLFQCNNGYANAPQCHVTHVASALKHVRMRRLNLCLKQHFHLCKCGLDG